MFLETTKKFGFLVGNRTEKITKIDDLHDFLLTEISSLKKRVIETIPDIYFIRETMAYDLEKNFDAVSAALGIPIACKEIELIVKNNLINKENKRNPLGFISMNSNLFKTNDNNKINRKQFRENY
jgi:hypothetical protein